MKNLIFILKGNALIVAQVAGIQASKLTCSLIPLCHQILLDNCHVELTSNSETKQIECRATCKTSTSKTGENSFQFLFSNFFNAIVIFQKVLKWKRWLLVQFHY